VAFGFAPKGLKDDFGAACFELCTGGTGAAGGVVTAGGAGAAGGILGSMDGEPLAPVLDPMPVRYEEDDPIAFPVAFGFPPKGLKDAFGATCFELCAGGTGGTGAAGGVVAAGGAGGAGGILDSYDGAAGEPLELIPER